MNLADQNILVTGASNGIGKEIAYFLMKNNANVAVHYNANKNAAVELISEFPKTNSKVFQADLADQEQCIGLWHQVSSHFSRVDSIVLNAGIFLEHKIEDPVDSWLEVWKKTMNVNLNAVGLLTKLGIEKFIEQGSGRFIFIGSRAVFRGETEEYLAYAASKGGLVSLARSVARSFGKYNIKSFIVSPGFVKTDMADQFIKVHGEQKILDELSLNELTEPKDISPLVGLMCSGLMDHATGATIDINAGSHIR